MERISNIWERLTDDHLLVFVGTLRKTDERAALSECLHLNHRPPNAIDYRRQLPYLHVRGTPASGKTTLALLLAYHINQQEPAAHIIYIPAWPLQRVRAVGGWRHYLMCEYGWTTTFGTKLFKTISTDDDRFAIAFASCGSPTSHLVRHGTTAVVSDWRESTPASEEAADNWIPAVSPIYFVCASHLTGRAFLPSSLLPLPSRHISPTETPMRATVPRRATLTRYKFGCPSDHSSLSTLHFTTSNDTSFPPQTQHEESLVTSRVLSAPVFANSSLVHGMEAV
ncbi:hypothetical protein BGY98DRAFT_1137080 [Russula aff. rugulosa BPL654]|nr:hypothetical protein BGY98DRAFT_1137080 [Russula aff. rugulosa BPL654]